MINIRNLISEDGHSVPSNQGQIQPAGVQSNIEKRKHAYITYCNVKLKLFYNWTI